MSAVEYLNTLPFIYGIAEAPFDGNFKVELDHPARCAEKLIGGEADIGLVPIAAWDKYKHLRQISRFGIASDGEVASVLLVSDVEIGEMDKIYLDYQSRTSNELLKLLMADYFHLKPNFVRGYPDFESHLGGNSAGLLIGDRAMRYAGDYRYQYDLSLIWKEWTGMPFVFAVWMANDRVGETLVDALSERFEAGLLMREKIVEEKQGDFPYYSLRKYLYNCIQYRLTERHDEAQALFLQKIGVTESSVWR